MHTALRASCPRCSWQSQLRQPGNPASRQPACGRRSFCDILTRVVAGRAGASLCAKVRFTHHAVCVACAYFYRRAKQGGIAQTQKVWQHESFTPNSCRGGDTGVAEVPGWLERGLRFSQCFCGGEANLKFFAVGETDALHFKKAAYPPRIPYVSPIQKTQGDKK